MAPKFKVGDIVCVVCKGCIRCNNTLGRVIGVCGHRATCYSYTLQVLRGSPCSVHFAEVYLKMSVSGALVGSTRQRKMRDHAGV